METGSIGGKKSNFGQQADTAPKEIIKEVEKIVYQGGGGGRGAGGGGAGGMSDEDCDCLTGARFLAVWNKLFKLSGPSTEECITED